MRNDKYDPDEAWPVEELPGKEDAAVVAAKSSSISGNKVELHQEPTLPGAGSSSSQAQKGPIDLFEVDVEDPQSDDASAVSAISDRKLMGKLLQASSKKAKEAVVKEKKSGKRRRSRSKSLKVFHGSVAKVYQDKPKPHCHAFQTTCENCGHKMEISIATSGCTVPDSPRLGPDAPADSDDCSSRSPSPTGPLFQQIDSRIESVANHVSCIRQCWAAACGYQMDASRYYAASMENAEEAAKASSLVNDLMQEAHKRIKLAISVSARAQASQSSAMTDAVMPNNAGTEAVPAETARAAQVAQKTSGGDERDLN